MKTLELKQLSYIEKRQPGGNWQAWLGEGLRQLALITPLRLLYTPLKVRGQEHLSGVGPVIFVANHSSHLDTPLLLAALPLKLRLRLKVAAAADYFYNRPWKGTLVSLMLNTFPFARQGAGCQASLRTAQTLIRQGHSLLIFPEGSRSQDGQLRPFKRGVGRLAAATGAAVVPVWIEGTGTAMPKGASWPHRHPVAITFGPPLSFSPAQTPEQITAQVENAVRTLGGQQRAEQAA